MREVKNTARGQRKVSSSYGTKKVPQLYAGPGGGGAKERSARLSREMHGGPCGCRIKPEGNRVYNPNFVKTFSLRGWEMGATTHCTLPSRQYASGGNSILVFLRMRRDKDQQRGSGIADG